MNKKHTKNAYRKDILRNIKAGRKRFIAIAVITLLGVMMFSGLQASCMDLRRSADRFFDEQNLHDLTVVSTLGLVDGDVKALQAADGVETAEGIYSEKVNTDIGDGSMSVQLQTLSDKGIDAPYLVEGRLPEKANETAVTQKFIKDSGLAVGDTFTIEQDDTEDQKVDSDTEEDGTDADTDVEINTDVDTDTGTASYNVSKFTIVGVVIDPTDVDNPFSAVSYRTDSSASDRAFIMPSAVDSDYYTAVNLRLSNTVDMECYGDEYERAVAEVRSDIETLVKPVREQARTDSIRGDAQAKLDDAKEEADSKIADARQQLADGEKELNDQLSTLQSQEASLQAALDAASSQGAGAVPQDSNAAQSGSTGALSSQAAAVPQDSNPAAEAGGAAGLAQYQEQLTSIQEGEKTIQEKLSELDEQKAELNESEQKADDQIADAQKKIDDIKAAQWYVQDRTSLSGYSNISSDADSIEAIGTVFPIVFFAVAVLISLTTVARMVDEDRGLIGTYKSLGFTDSEIRLKYLIYSLLACAAGSAAGTVMAFIGLPTFIFYVFHVMYLLPTYEQSFLPTYGIAGPALFTVGVLAATWAACRKELRETPASLMRPKSPRAGSRVLLERITPLWKRMSFLNKVTARNLFRYKGRLFMTIFGIGGCMALLLFGFAIRDSVHDLEPRQYEQTSLYDVMAVATADDNDKLLSYIDGDSAVKDYVNVELTSVKLKHAEDGDGSRKDIGDTAADESGGVSNNGSNGTDNERGGVTAQLIVVPDGKDFSSYVNFEAINCEQKLTLADGDIFVTRNVGDVLGFSDGDTITMQLPDLEESSIPVTAVVENYLSNYVYMTESTFEQYYDAFEPNAVLLHLSGTCSDQAGWAEALGKRDGLVSCVSTEKLREEFSGSFQLINMVVYIIIGMSAALAFVVLFTLSTTNISERERELATIKVLGFYDREVHSYVNKETFILTGIGIVLGIPLGRAFAQTLSVILKLPSIYLAVSLHGISYVYAAALTVIFAWIVSRMTNRTLNRIDPATALKSVE